jgi:hypothetical protein
LKLLWFSGALDIGLRPKKIHLILARCLRDGYARLKFVLATPFRLNVLPSDSILTGVGNVFSERNTAHHLIFFVRDRATATMVRRK